MSARQNNNQNQEEDQAFPFLKAELDRIIKKYDFDSEGLALNVHYQKLLLETLVQKSIAIKEQKSAMSDLEIVTKERDELKRRSAELESKGRSNEDKISSLT